VSLGCTLDVSISIERERTKLIGVGHASGRLGVAVTETNASAREDNFSSILVKKTI
jgi:hypothetical protein